MCVRLRGRWRFVELTNAVRILIFDIVPVLPNFKAGCRRSSSFSSVFDAIVCALALAYIGDIFLDEVCYRCAA